MRFRSSAAALALALPAACLGQDSRIVDDDAAQTYAICQAKGYDVPDLCRDRARFRPYEPNWVIGQRTEGDDDAIRLHYSLRYNVLAPQCLSDYRANYVDLRVRHEEAKRTRQDTPEFLDQLARERDATDRKLLACLQGYAERSEIYLMYTGEFDFYYGTRESGPVINRVSNPGIHYRQYRQLPKPQDRDHTPLLAWWDFGFEHRSNGQATDARATTTDAGGNVRYRAQIAYEQNDRAYLDTISQETNFATAEVKFEAGEWLELWARVKPFYFANDTAVTWGPHAADNVKMADYDRFRFVLSWTFGNKSRRTAERQRIDLEWTLGDKWLKTDSWNFGLYLPVKLFGLNIPLYARVHRGPLHTLSDFTQEVNAYGIGFLLLE